MENKNNNRHAIISIPFTGCLTIIIFAAIAGTMINECKRSKIRLENDKRKYKNDTIAAQKTTAINVLFLKDFPHTR